MGVFQQRPPRGPWGFPAGLLDGANTALGVGVWWWLVDAMLSLGWEQLMEPPRQPVTAGAASWARLF